MTEDQRTAILKALKRQAARKVSKKAALKELKDAGFLTQAGDLSPEYGGFDNGPQRTKAEPVAA